MKKKNFRINNTHSNLTFWTGYLKDLAKLGPILFNIIVNDLLIWISNSELLNFASLRTITQ